MHKFLLGMVGIFLTGSALAGENWDSKVKTSIRPDGSQWMELLSKEGHGGQSVVCRSSDGRIESAELLDLYEARVMYGLELLRSGEPKENYIRQAAEKLNGAIRGNYFYTNYKDIFGGVQRITRFIPNGSRLKPIDDSLPVVLPKNCQVEQLAIYVDQTLLLVDREIWDNLDELNRAALVTHEGIYLNMRISERSTDSRRARRVNGHLLSTFEFENVVSGLENYREVYSCTSQAESEDWSKSYSFLAFKNARGWGVQPLVMAGIMSYSRKWFTMDFDDFLVNVTFRPPGLDLRPYMMSRVIVGLTLNSKFEDGEQLHLIFDSVDKAHPKLLVAHLKDFTDPAPGDYVEVNCSSYMPQP